MELKTAVIRKCREQDLDDRPADEQRWCLYTRDGQKLLGRHPSKDKALKQERAIQVRKHGAAQQLLFRGAVYRLVATELDVGLPTGTQRQRRRVLIRSLVENADALGYMADSLLTYLAIGRVEPGGRVSFKEEQLSFLARSLDSLTDKLKSNVEKLKAGI